MSLTDQPPAPFGPRRYTPQAAAVTQAEVQAARELLQDFGLARPSLAAALAAALADAREGALVPGERVQGGATLDVSGRTWRDAPTMHARHRQAVRLAWVKELERSGLRPLGWPPVTTTFLRFRPLSDRPMVDDPLTKCEEDQADLVRLRVQGLAVRTDQPAPPLERTDA